MPVDSHGTYRHNDQSARMHSGGREAMKDRILSGKPAEEPKEEEGGKVEEHLKSMHAETGEAHSHVAHHIDGSHTSHHIDEAGEVTGPHDHENTEALKDHMDQFLNEEDHEGEDRSEENGEGMLHSHALGM